MTDEQRIRELGLILKTIAREDNVANRYHLCRYGEALLYEYEDMKPLDMEYPLGFRIPGYDKWFG